MMPGLAAVASALNDKNLCRARIAAVHLRIPELPDEFARLEMETEDLLVKVEGRSNHFGSGGWDPDEHPRTGTAPNPGWFAPKDGGGEAAEDNAPDEDQALRLPPGERNDEIGDLLEWIANAKPEDAPAINREINQLFYQAGDFNGGAMFHHALAEVLRHPDQETRQRVLDSYEPLTRRDPSEIAEFNAWVEGAALGRLPAFQSLISAIRPARSAEEAVTATTTAVETSEATEAVASEFWKRGWSARGFAIHEALKGNLPWWFKGIDDFSETGVATSFKSIDLNAATYQNAKQLLDRINKYVGDLAKFNGKSYENWKVPGDAITQRVLKLVIPKGSTTAEQASAIDEAIGLARSRGIDVLIIPF